MSSLENKRILITGGAGSIGSELVRQLAPHNKVYIYDINETEFFDLFEEMRLKNYDVQGRIGDVRDKEALHDVFYSFNPKIVFHAAALKHVTPNEWFPIEAVNTNIVGSYNVLNLAQKYGVEALVNVSTDKVINSESIMGATKKVAELMAKNFGFVSVRFGNVLGSRGSLIPIWQRQIDKKEDITVTSEEMERFFMTIPEACSLLIKAAEVGRPGEVLVMDMGKPIKIIDLAKKIIEEYRADVGIKIIGTRPGEAMTERLMTIDEQKESIKVDGFYILHGNNRGERVLEEATA